MGLGFSECSRHVNSFFSFVILSSGQKEKPLAASPRGQPQTGESGLLGPEGSSSGWGGVGREERPSPRPLAFRGELPTDASRKVT